MKSLKDNQSVSIYLKQATQDIRNGQIKKDIQDELLCHIESEVERMQLESSISTEDAVKKAIENLGSPQTICSSFFRIYHRSRRTLLKLASLAAAVVVLVGSYYVGTALNEARVKQQQYVASIQPYVDLYLEDVAEVERNAVFKPTIKGRDAGEFMNDRIAWAVSDSNPHILPYGLRKERLAMPFSALRSAARFRQHYDLDQVKAKTVPEIDDLSKFEKESIATADLSWMKDLLEYDYWDLHRVGPFADATKSEVTNWNGTSSEVPMPELDTFFPLATLRLLRGWQFKEPLQALREVRQLALLLYSTETTEGASTAVSILDMEESFYNKYVELGLIKSDEFTPMSHATLFRMRRLIEAAPVFLSYNVTRDNSIFQKVFTRPALPPGTCGAYLKTVNMARLNRTSWYTYDGYADTEYAKNSKVLRERLKDACRLSYIRGDVTAEQWAQNLRDTEIPKHNFVADMRMQNWDIWKYWYVMKIALKVPHVRNTYVRYMASDNYPYFPVEYKDWHKFAKTFEGEGKTH